MPTFSCLRLEEAEFNVKRWLLKTVPLASKCCEFLIGLNVTTCSVEDLRRRFSKFLARSSNNAVERYDYAVSVHEKFFKRTFEDWRLDLFNLLRANREIHREEDEKEARVIKSSLDAYHTLASLLANAPIREDPRIPGNNKNIVEATLRLAMEQLENEMPLSANRILHGEEPSVEAKGEILKSPFDLSDLRVDKHISNILRISEQVVASFKLERNSVLNSTQNELSYLDEWIEWVRAKCLKEKKTVESYLERLKVFIPRDVEWTANGGFMVYAGIRAFGVMYYPRRSLGSALFECHWEKDGEGRIVATDLTLLSKADDFFYELFTSGEPIQELAPSTMTDEYLNIHPDGLDSLPRCPDCGVKEGEIHDYGCDMSRCPYCGNQLIACSCIRTKLRAGCITDDGTKKQEREWITQLEIFGRIPYFRYPILCSYCGEKYPNLFTVSDVEWHKYIEPNHRRDVICRSCFERIKRLTDRAAKRKPA